MDSEKLDSIEKTLQRFIECQEAHNEKVLTEIATINRGVYGDDKNEAPGLLNRMRTAEIDVRSLKRTRTRLVYWGLGIAAGFNTAIFVVKELWKKL